MDATRVSASEFQKAFGAMSDKALREPITPAATARVMLALLGAAVVLWPAQAIGWQSLPLPRSDPSEA